MSVAQQPAADELGTRLRRATEPRSIAILGIALGILALWLSLPPFTLRNIVVPLAVAIAGAAAGLWSVTREERKLGWWAIGASALGVLCAVWFQS